MRRALLTAVCLACLAMPASALAARGPAGAAERLAAKTIIDLDGVLDDARETLAEAAALPSVQANDATACQAETAALEEPRYTGVGAAELDGDLWCFSPGLPSPVNIADRAYFLRALGTRDLGVGDYQIGRATGIGSIGLGYPVNDDDGRVTGVVIAPLGLPWLGDRIERRASEKAADNLILDDHGTVLARSGAVATESGTNLGRSKLVKDVLTEDFGDGRYRLAGTPVAAAWGTVPLSDGELHVAISVPR